MFFYFCIFLGFLCIILVFSQIQIELKNVKISTEKNNGKIINNNYLIQIKIYVLKKIRLLKIKITQDKLKNIQIKKIINKIDIENTKFTKLNKEQFRIIKEYKPQIEYINLKINIGTEDTFGTSLIVAIISTILGIALNKQLKNKKNTFIITPIYTNKNILKINLNCILKIKMIHIIYILYIINTNKGVDNNVRTSNRRNYAHSYE